MDAKNHPVFKELTRVRQYFEKIKNIEEPPPKRPEQSLNKEAAIRFIRSDLADNKEVNTKLTEMIAKERAKAALKTAQQASKRKADESGSSEDSDVKSDSQKAQTDPPAKKKKKDRKEKAKKNSK